MCQKGDFFFFFLVWIREERGSSEPPEEFETCGAALMDWKEPPGIQSRNWTPECEIEKKKWEIYNVILEAGSCAIPKPSAESENHLFTSDCEAVGRAGQTLSNCNSSDFRAEVRDVLIVSS